MTDRRQPAAVGGILWKFGPALVAASGFALADVLGKPVLHSGADVLTLTTVRGLVGLVVLFLWLALIGRPVVAVLRLGGTPDGAPAARTTLTANERRLAWLVGVIMTANIYFIYVAIAATEVPVAILTYFVYPLLTGIAASLTGIERLTWRGAAAALVAFGGLALIIGAHPLGVAAMGIIAALIAAVCRVAMMLIARAWLTKADALLVTWHSLLVSTALYLVFSLVTSNWHPPGTLGGWAALVTLGASTTIGILCVFVSTIRIGPFPTALFMNLEPLLTTILSAAFLGEVLTAPQLFGGAIMLAALVSFQLRR